MLDRIGNDALYVKDSTFKVVKGLAGGHNTVSLESVNYPGSYLRHQNYLMKLSPHGGFLFFKAKKCASDSLCRKDATFYVRSGLSGTKGGISFEAYSPGKFFIRHQMYRCRVDREQGSRLYKMDATWIPSYSTSYRGDEEEVPEQEMEDVPEQEEEDVPEEEEENVPEQEEEDA